MVFRFRGVPLKEVNGLPYSVHQIGPEAWQIVIQNCARFPAGYTFTSLYGSQEEALQALQLWPSPTSDSALAGDDTGVSFEMRLED